MIKLNKGDNAIVSIGEYIMRLSDTEIPLYITTDFEEDDTPNLLTENFQQGLSSTCRWNDTLSSRLIFFQSMMI